MSSTTERDRVADLLSVLDISRQLGSIVELLPLLQLVERSALEVLDCERATVFLYDRETNELFTQVATDAQPFRIPAKGQGFAATAFTTGELINVPDAYADPRFNSSVDKATGFRTRNILTSPLVGWGDERLGVIQVLNKRGGPFEEWDEELVRTFGAQVGVAVQRQVLLEEYAKKRRFERDLDIARQIQQGLLPQVAPVIPGYDIAGWNEAADETGGDFYDFQKLSDSTWAITVADASGHGIGAALVTANCRALLRATLSNNNDICQSVPIVNNLICEDLLDSRFVTAFVGLLRPSANVVRYLSMGHGPLLLYRRSTDSFEELPVQGFPLGVVPGVTYDDPGDVDLNPGDFITLITDGFFEWESEAGEAFGIPRIQQCLRESREVTADEMIRRLHQTVTSFVGASKQVDDLTAVIVKRQ